MSTVDNSINLTALIRDYHESPSTFSAYDSAQQVKFLLLLAAATHAEQSKPSSFFAQMTSLSKLLMENMSPTTWMHLAKWKPEDAKQDPFNEEKEEEEEDNGEGESGDGGSGGDYTEDEGGDDYGGDDYGGDDYGGDDYGGDDYGGDDYGGDDYGGDDYGGDDYGGDDYGGDDYGGGTKEDESGFGLYKPGDEIKEIAITLKLLSGTTWNWIENGSITVKQLKQQISDRKGISIENQNIVHNGKSLDDNERLSSYADDSTVTVDLLELSKKKTKPQDDFDLEF